MKHNSIKTFEITKNGKIFIYRMKWAPGSLNKLLYNSDLIIVIRICNSGLIYFFSSPFHRINPEFEVSQRL